jgi:hypothetical protein
MTDIGGLKDELVGHSTLVVLAIIGLAFYSLSYSLMYASSSSVPVVAVLEMWMVSSHLSVAGLSLILQSIGVKYAKINAPLPFVASVQTSIFLGISLVVSITAVSCIQGENAICKGFYGASVFPSISSVISLGWSWVMYISSLGCQTWNTGGFTLGVSDSGLMIIACLLIVVPSSIVGKLFKTCQNGGLLCGNSEFICDPILSIVFCFLGITVFSLGFVLKAEELSSGWNICGMVLRILGICVLFVVCILIMAVVPAKYNGVYLIATIMVCLNLMTSIVCCDIKSLIRAGKRKIKDTKK